ncbi:hypothetical protein Clo1100_2941 [Clostridium sp. BNL1100]|nr:hypothetical protein Clo1100_2941 [Clostridium sp. BNL1100]
MVITVSKKNNKKFDIPIENYVFSCNNDLYHSFDCSGLLIHDYKPINKRAGKEHDNATTGTEHTESGGLS